MFNRATLIWLLRSMNDEDSDVCCSDVESAQRLIDRGTQWNGLDCLHDVCGRKQSCVRRLIVILPSE